MRAFFAASLPENPWLLGTFFAVMGVFIAVLAFSLKPGQDKAIQDDSELPLQD